MAHSAGGGSWSNLHTRVESGQCRVSEHTLRYLELERPWRAEGDGGRRRYHTYGIEIAEQGLDHDFWRAKLSLVYID